MASAFGCRNFKISTTRVASAIAHRGCLVSGGITSSVDWGEKYKKRGGEMRVLTIKKRGGGQRVIYVPSGAEKRELKEIYGRILLPRMNAKELPFAHGFMPQRSIVTNALPHVGKAVTISFDIKDFFDSVTVEKFPNGSLPTEVKKCFIGTDGVKAARQGLPTSPALANLAAKPLDEAIVKGLKKRGISATYTRYADDLSISLDKDDPNEIEVVKKVVFEAAARCGFKINKKKIKIQRTKSGRREICGLMVDDEGVHVPRRLKRKIRAARHAYRQACQVGDVKKAKKAANSLAGLLEFSLLKLPSERGEEKNKENLKKKSFKEAKKLVRGFQLAWGINPRVKKIIPEQVLEERNDRLYIITNDPVYFLGISSFTTRFTSCMKLGDGSYYRGVAFWQHHPGVSVAIEVNRRKTITIKGITRHEIISRTLLYHLRNGKTVFGDVYGGGHGHSVDVNRDLSRVLIKHGIKPCYEYSGVLVAGNVIRTGEVLPYFDNVTAEFVTLKPSGRKAIRLRIK